MHIDTNIIKQVGVNGQISLGKEYAGKQVQISKMNDGTLIIKTGQFVPSSEQWLHTDHNIEKLDEAILWLQSHPRSDNFEEIKHKIDNE